MIIFFRRPTSTLTDLLPFYWQPVASGTILRYLNINEDPQVETTQNLKLRFTTHKFFKNLM